MRDASRTSASLFDAEGEPRGPRWSGAERHAERGGPGHRPEARVIVAVGEILQMDADVDADATSRPSRNACHLETARPVNRKQVLPGTVAAVSCAPPSFIEDAVQVTIDAGGDVVRRRTLPCVGGR